MNNHFKAKAAIDGITKKYSKDVKANLINDYGCNAACINAIPWERLNPMDFL